MKIKGFVRLTWRSGADFGPRRPCVEFYNNRRQPPKVPGVWLSSFDRNNSGCFCFDWWRICLLVEWEDCYLRAVPKGLKSNYDVTWRQAQLYHGVDVSARMRALWLERDAIDKQLDSLKWYGTTEEVTV